MALDQAELEGAGLQVQQQPGVGQLAAQQGKGVDRGGGSQLQGHGLQARLAQEIEAGLHRLPGQGHEHQDNLGFRCFQHLKIEIESVGGQGEKAVQFVGHHLGEILRGRGGQGRLPAKPQVGAYRQAHRRRLQPPCRHDLLEPGRQVRHPALAHRQENPLGHLQPREVLLHLNQGEPGLVEINPQSLGSGQQGGGQLVPPDIKFPIQFHLPFRLKKAPKNYRGCIRVQPNLIII